METLQVGSDFSGVGAFDQALIRLGIDYQTIFACDMDKYARQTYSHNYGLPIYYPENVYDRIIPEKPLDIYMTSPPCQAFSLAGKRKGEEDKRGVLFYNSHEFIKKNNPRFFIFENVKGLLSDDSGKTFQRWIDLLAGKSVNGNPVIFPNEEATPYHVYYQVLNAKHYGIPQNRERIFIIGIRDDEDNDFCFPKTFPLEKRLKDVLESEVDEKYFLSKKMLEKITFESKNNGEVANLNKGGERVSVYSINSEVMSCLSATDFKQPKQIMTQEIIQINDPSHSNDRIYSEKGISPTLNTMQGGSRQPFVLVSCDVIQLNPSKESGGKQPYQQNRIYDIDGVNPALTTLWNGANLIELKRNTITQQKIRKLTPRECFRLMDFPDSFDFSCVSDSQAYKQAGNSICVGVVMLLIKNILKN